MGKKKRAIKNHEHHHQKAEDFMEAHVPRDVHIVPTKRGFHVPHPWCYCVPTVEDEDPRTLKRVWMHRDMVH